MKKQSKLTRCINEKKKSFPSIKSEEYMKNDKSQSQKKAVFIKINSIEDIEKRKKLIQSIKPILKKLEEDNDGGLLF
ncbi:MAG: hypothetical protein NZ903_01250 [Candidatus Micrarchaeota archaeon]|nr:hypothetical protein [Candidatus Micrarchaeota archaeon]